ncbi:phosphotransferase [Streptomyces sp. SID14478]|uniref:maltokinase N-terminal cap-like domain-containing protein n=1 Tax=Streptomyces sp. SID14478 TaxID=2706073 RepID=UPI0013D94D87|nr:phosphotransferase [Streptomyces sp. SID14478]NEB75706.1 phosphotransferase [Streptomyces sp. SID14478]
MSSALLTHSRVSHAQLAALLARWLPDQRWFAGRDHRITDLSVVTATQLTTDCFHLLIRVEQHGEQDSVHYQLLLGATDRIPPRTRRHVLGEIEGPTGHALLVHDAVHDHRAMVHLLDRIRRGGAMKNLRFESFPRTGVPSGLAPHVLDTEQSNTSIVYGNQLILKLFRRVQPGINPDLEVPAALARYGYARVPAPTAWFHTMTPFFATLGVVQPYLTDAADGWALARESAARRTDFVEEARQLGRATAELHVALSETFPVTAAPADHSIRLADAMTHRLRQAAAHVPALRAYAPALTGVFADFALSGHDLPLQRIHGDFHLGQVLRAGDEWHIVDFEGEPSKPLTERRGDHSPVGDIAGMLRSFDYAAHTDTSPRTAWAQRSRAAFCDGYAESGRFAPHAIATVLRAHEADRAVYEVLYEAAHRPDWIAVPLTAVDRMCRAR